jgi:hypothetical protein
METEMLQNSVTNKLNDMKKLEKYLLLVSPLKQQMLISDIMVMCGDRSAKTALYAHNVVEIKK